jgi:hypothetical protein
VLKKERDFGRCVSRASLMTTKLFMPTLEIYEYELPVPVEDLERVQRILRNNHAFCAGPTPADIYDWRACRKAHADGVTVLALIDRNVLNDVVTLASTATTDSTEPLANRARFGAAVMAYLLCCNIVVDPGLAVHEWPTDALDKLTLFRRADEADAAIYVDIALERKDRFARHELPPPKVAPTLQTVRGKVSGREEHRLAVLKIAEMSMRRTAPLWFSLKILGDRRITVAKQKPNLFGIVDHLDIDQHPSLASHSG